MDQKRLAPAIRLAAALAAAAGLTLALVRPALAHAGDAGYVLLLPTGYYRAGGALAVALSFVILAATPAARLHRLASWRGAFAALDLEWRTVLGTLSFLIFACLILAGFFGSTDPLSNPLPLVFWTLLWAGFAVIEGVFGDVWWWINPWYAPYRLVVRLTGRREAGEQAGGLGYWPGILLFLGFAWFELVDPAPEDPTWLAEILGVYYLFTLAATLVFGYERWMRHGEALSAFFRMISGISLFAGERVAHKMKIALAPPGGKLATAKPLPLSGILFLLLALSSVSFDGLSRTFFWLGLNDVNPLAFPGRSAVIGVNTAGLVGMFAALSGAFLLAVWLGERISPSSGGFLAAAGALVWSIIPISLAYHIAHNLTAFLVEGQYALAAISDPFARGWDLFGTAGFEVRAGVVAGYRSAWWIWNVEAAVIIIGHMLAVAVAHVIAGRLHKSARAAMLGQLPLAVLMVFYTVFGLWLLSTATGA